MSTKSVGIIEKHVNGLYKKMKGSMGIVQLALIVQAISGLIRPEVREQRHQIDNQYSSALIQLAKSDMMNNSETASIKRSENLHQLQKKANLILSKDQQIQNSDLKNTRQLFDKLSNSLSKREFIQIVENLDLRTSTQIRKEHNYVITNHKNKLNPKSRMERERQ